MRERVPESPKNMQQFGQLVVNQTKPMTYLNFCA